MRSLPEGPLRWAKPKEVITLGSGHCCPTESGPTIPPKKGKVKVPALEIRRPPLTDL